MHVIFYKLRPEWKSAVNTKEIRDSLTKIKCTELIIFSKPDKESGTVIFNKDDYIYKMLKIVPMR